MNYFGLIPLLAFLASGFTSAVVIGRNIGKAEHKTFLLYSLIIQAWAASDFLLWNIHDTGYYTALLKLQSVFWISAGFLFLNFVHVFLRKPRTMVFNIMCLLSAAGFLATIFTDHVITGYKVHYWGVMPVPGALFMPVVLVTVLAPFGYSLHMMARVLRSNRDEQRGIQLLLLFLGTLFAVINGIATMLLPIYFNFDMVCLAATGTVIQTIFIFIALTRYSFLSLGLHDAAEEIFRNIHDAVIIVNARGRILNYNASAYRMLRDSLHDNRFSTIIEGYEHGKPYETFETRVHLVNETRAVFLTQAPIKQNRAVSGYILIMKDITVKKAMETQLIDRNKELDTFVYKASHDLKGPLASIRGLVYLAKPSVSDSSLKAYLEMIDKTAHRLENVMLDLLEVTKIRKCEVRSEKIYFRKLVDDILDSLQYKSGFRYVTIEAYCQEEATFYSDPLSIGSVLQNLIVNGINYRNPDAFASWLDITIKTSARGAEIIVADNGLGIHEDHHARVFEMFYRASPGIEGSGLGLYIVKNAVTKLKGSIRMESVEKKGTTFTIFIPQAVKNYGHESKSSLPSLADAILQQ